MNIPSLADTIRTTQNRSRYSALTNTNPFQTDWLAAEQRMGAMSPQPQQQPQAMSPRAIYDKLADMGNEAAQDAGYGGGVLSAPAPMMNPVADPFAPSKAATDAFKRGGEDDPFSRAAQRAPMGFSMGGLVTGPGGPKDDMVPAMIDGKHPARLSSLENVDDFPSVYYHGLKTYDSLKQKAHEGLREMGIDPINFGKQMPMMGGMANGGMGNGKGPMPMMAMGGPVPGYNAGGMVASPWYEMLSGPMQRTAAADAQTSADVQSQLDAAGRVFGAPDPMPGPGTMFARGYQPAAPDPVREGYANDVAARAAEALAGPMVPTGAPMNPNRDIRFDDAWLNRNGAMPVPVMQAPPPTVDDMKFRGLAARAALDNSRQDAGAPVASTFMAPWEKRDAERAARDAASGRPEGVRATDWRRFQGSPQGLALQEQAKMQQAAQAAAAQQWREQNAVQFQQGMARDNAQIGAQAALRGAERGQDAQARADELAVRRNFEMADRNAALGMDAARQAQAEKARMDQLAVQRNYDMADRNMQIGAESALYGAREAAKSAQGPQIKTSPKMDPKVGVQFNVMDDNTRVPARIPNPTDTDKLNYLRYFENKPDLTADKMTPDDWVRAWHYATSGAAPGKTAESPDASRPASKIKSATEVK